MAVNPLSLLLQSRLYRDNIRLLAGVTLFVWCWMLIYTFCFYRPVYTSDAWVMIKDSAITSGYVQAETYVAEKTTSSNAANPVLNTMGLLSSARIMEDLYQFLAQQHPEQLRQIGVRDKRDWQNFYKDGSAIIKAKNKAGTDLINLHVSWTDPVIAQQMAVVALDAFQHASQELNREEQRNRRRYLEDEVAKLEKKLQGVRAQKSDFKRQNKTIDAERESLELTKLRMGFESRLNETLAAAEGRQAELSRYQKMLGMTPEQALKASAIGMNPTISRLKGELYELSATEAYLSSNLTDRNPKVREVRARMAQVQDDLGDELRQTLGHKASLGTMGTSVSDAPRARVVGQLVSAQADVIRLNQEASALKKRLGVIDNTIRQFPKVEEGLRNIEQGETSLSDSLDALRKKLTEARLKEAQTLSNVFIVDSARLPLKSNYPAKADLALLSLALGLVLGVLAVVLRWKLQLDRRLKHGLRLVLRSLEPRRAEADEKATRADDAPESFDQALDDIFAPRSTMGDRLPHSASALTQADLATVSPQVLRQRLSELTHDYVARLSRFEAQSQVLAKQVVMLRQHEQQADGADSAASRTPMTGQRQKIQQSAADLKRERQALERRATMIRRLEAFLATPSPRKPAGSAEEIKRRLLKRYMMQRSASLQSSAATPQAS